MDYCVIEVTQFLQLVFNILKKKNICENNFFLISKNVDSS